MFLPVMAAMPSPSISVGSSTGLLWMLPFTLHELEKALEAMLAGFEKFGRQAISGSVLELNLVDDVQMAELNHTYLGCAGPTNILSFPAPGDEKDMTKGIYPLGWMALSVETISREAMLYKQELPCYALKMLAHGLAHLLGYEHGEEMDQCADYAATAAGQHFLRRMEP